VITTRPIDPREFQYAGGSSGAVVTFAGVVRNSNEGREVTGMHYDCYREMAEQEIARIIDEVKATTSVQTIDVVHRIGELAVGEVSLVVVVKAPHRRQAFGAAQQVIDELKRRVPIWKKEHYADSESRWL
jgi:molybdopterin synthase catalytic subunit